MHGTRRRGVFAIHAAFLLLIAASFAASGCRPSRPISTYECLSQYDRMSDAYEPLVSLVYVPRATDLSRYRGIIVGDVGVGQEWVECREKAFGYATFFRVVLQRELVRLGQFEFITLEKAGGDYTEHPEGVLRLEGMVTRLDMGSGWMRYFSYFLFFLQSGATDFQVEGRLSEEDSGRLVVEFVDRRRGVYNTPFGPNPRTLRRGFAMNTTVKDTAQCLASFIEKGCEELPATEPGTPDGGD